MATIAEQSFNIGPMENIFKNYPQNHLITNLAVMFLDDRLQNVCFFVCFNWKSKTAASTRQSDLTLDQMENFYETINLIDPKLYMNIPWMSVFMNSLGKSLS